MRLTTLPLLPSLVIARTSLEEKCNDLAGMFVGEQVVVLSMEYLHANFVINQEAVGFNETCAFWSAPPVSVDLCRVGIKITTSSSSSTLIEVWLPGKWEGRYLQIGNSRTGGCKYTYVHC